MAVLTISNFDDTLYDAFCTKAAAQNRSVNELVVEALQRGFAEQVFPVKEDSPEQHFFVKEEAVAWPAVTPKDLEYSWDDDGFSYAVLKSVHDRRTPWREMTMEYRSATQQAIEILQFSLEMADTYENGSFGWRDEAVLKLLKTWKGDFLSDEIERDIYENRKSRRVQEEF